MLDLAAWSRFVRRIADPRRAARTGIMVAQRRSHSYPSGLFVYRKDVDLQYGLVLTADHFVAVDIIDQRPVMSALMAALDALARHLGCGAIRSMMHMESNDAAPALRGAGYRLEGTVLCKQLDRVADPEVRPGIRRLPTEAALAAGA